MSAEEIKLEVICNQFTGNENSVELIDSMLDMLLDGFGAKVMHASGQLGKFKAFVDPNLRPVCEVTFFMKLYSVVEVRYGRKCDEMMCK